MDDFLMQALVFEYAARDTSATRVTSVVAPRPAPGEVTIDVRYAGINFKDIMSRRGDPGYVDSWPFTPGLEVAGTVREIGFGTTDLEVGQQVLALTNAGGLAQVATAKANLTVPIPAGVEMAVAAAVPGALTTAQLLLHHSARVRDGDVLLVHSASGSVGQAVAQIGKLIPGVRLLGVVGSDSRRTGALAAGYEAAFTRSRTLAAEVLAHLDGRGVDAVFDPQGTDWIDQDIQALNPGGTVVIFGNAAGVPLDELPPLPQLLGRNIAIGGFSLAALSGTKPDAVSQAMIAVLEHLRRGAVRPPIRLVSGLASAAAAQQALSDGVAITKQIVEL